MGVCTVCSWGCRVFTILYHRCRIKSKRIGGDYNVVKKLIEKMNWENDGK